MLGLDSDFDTDDSIDDKSFLMKYDAIILSRSDGDDDEQLNNLKNFYYYSSSDDMESSFEGSNVTSEKFSESHYDGGENLANEDLNEFQRAYSKRRSSLKLENSSGSPKNQISSSQALNSTSQQLPQ
jgi:hypothetical protein